MQHCFIVCSRSLEGVPLEVLELTRDAFRIAVDGGEGRVAALGLEPHLWLGDGDSVEGAAAKKRFAKSALKLPRDKNYTDLEFALYAAGQAFVDHAWHGEVFLLGAQGGRLDHELGNFLAVQSWLRDMANTIGVKHCPNVFSYGSKGLWAATSNEIAFEQPKGMLFSILGLAGAPRLTITGAKYNLRAKKFDHATVGISNEGMGREVKVKVLDGKKPDPVFVLFPEAY
jgi:thiamine pyrophosphokinase